MKEKRDEIIILRLTKTEKNRIYEKMFSMGIRSLSAYIRKMALDGSSTIKQVIPFVHSLFNSIKEEMRCA